MAMGSLINFSLVLGRVIAVRQFLMILSILYSAHNDQTCLILLLDLTAAIDIVDHVILIEHLIIVFV